MRTTVTVLPKTYFEEKGGSPEDIMTLELIEVFEDSGEINIENKGRKMIGCGKLYEKDGALMCDITIDEEHTEGRVIDPIYIRTQMKMIVSSVSVSFNATDKVD